MAMVGSLKTKYGRMVLATLTAFGVAYILFIGLKNIFRYNTFKLEKERLVSMKINLTRVNAEYRSKLQTMQTDEYWEMQARRHLGYIKPGETTYKLIYNYKNWSKM